MREIHRLFDNDYGIAFRWKNCDPKEYKKIQLVFNDIGFSLSEKKIKKFLTIIKVTIKYPSICEACDNHKNCKSYLLETPSSMISLAMSYTELKKLEELLEGALFQIEMDNMFGTGIVD